MIRGFFLRHRTLALFCLPALGLSAQTGPIRVEKLPGRINSANYDETNPVVSRDGKTLYFTRVGYPGFKRTLYENGKDLSVDLKPVEYEKRLRRIYTELADEQVDDPGRSSFNQDIWIARSLDDREFSQIEHPDYPVNNALPNSVCSLTPDPDAVVVINEFYQDGSMFKGFSTLKQRSDGSWEHPRPMHIYEMSDYAADVNLFLSQDGEVALLSLEKKDSYGENDLYVSLKAADNLWSAPVNLGPVVNTAFREATPFLSADKKTLFFASNRPGGKGGSDIYITHRLDDSWTRWTRPRSIGVPVNSTADDAQPFLNEATGWLYFSSRREGDSNIYRVRRDEIMTGREEEEEAFAADAVTAREPADMAASRSRTASREVRFICRIVHARTRKPLEGTVRFGLASDATPANKVSTERGTADFSLIANSYIRIAPDVDGFICREVLVHPARILQSGKTEEEIIFLADPIEVDARISLNPIYFEKSKAIVLPDSYAELDRLAAILRKHDKISVLIAGHTDNSGDLSLLPKLSLDRADAIRDYLVSKGIAPSRISTRGYGGTQPISAGTGEADRARNRRVEVIIEKIGP